MDIFSFGMLAGMIVTIIFIGIIKIRGDEEEPKEETPDVLAAKLRAIAMTINIDKIEREIIKRAAEYIEKGIEDNEEG